MPLWACPWLSDGRSPSDRSAKSRWRIDGSQSLPDTFTCKTLIMCHIANIVVTASVEPEIAEALRDQARQENTTVSAVVRRALHREFDSVVIEDGRSYHVLWGKRTRAGRPRKVPSDA